MLRPHGVVTMTIALLSLNPGSFAHFGTCCTSFCWINSGTHKRSICFPNGDESLPYVKQGTQLAAITAALATLCWARGSVFSIENPVNSRLFVSAPMQAMLRC